MIEHMNTWLTTWYQLQSVEFDQLRTVAEATKEIRKLRFSFFLSLVTK